MQHDMHADARITGAQHCSASDIPKVAGRNGSGQTNAYLTGQTVLFNQISKNNSRRTFYK